MITKQKKTLFTSLPTQHKKTDKLECSGVYRNCEQSISVKQEEKSAYESRNIDKKRSEIAEHIARPGHEIEWKSTDRLAAFGENTRKRKIRKAIEIVTKKDLMNMKLEEDRISENFAYCLNKLGDEQKKTTGSRQYP
ncbi:unnamed protein product [Protopolystoma xenopodis]|uniref:Uncharacterized protein n=1 Tax=Protopolystoma xenopodis TaxID=117903 RepID=A0A448WV18_9PLAT|nr:unnamed protein product [Protopolystoma xenopodis]